MNCIFYLNFFGFFIFYFQVDEGIEAMLCCFLQQLQEFGGPEVDKPDLLKGSIGSLKNLGLSGATKTNSGSGSLARHNTNTVDLKARYNVCMNFYFFKVLDSFKTQYVKKKH